MTAAQQMSRAKLYKRYPLANILIYNGSTVLHFLLGGVGIMLGYSLWKEWAYGAGIIYLLFAFGEMYVLMPLVVCPKCVYYRLKDGVCISGLNVVSRKVARAGKGEDFGQRAQGVLSPNNLYMVSLVLPLLALIPALVINFSWMLLGVFAVILGLLLFRFFVIFPQLACLHCQAKYICPQAGMMGVREK
jgi:4-hydroxybenzoate polyprenyltransferase